MQLGIRGLIWFDHNQPWPVRDNSQGLGSDNPLTP